MKLQIDFYSKDEFSIQLDFTGRYPFPANETSELFVLSCFTLRHLSNMGEHPAAQALAGMLITSSCIENAFINKTDFPKGEELSSKLISFTMQAVPQSWEMEKIVQVSSACQAPKIYTEDK